MAESGAIYILTFLNKFNIILFFKISLNAGGSIRIHS